MDNVNIILVTVTIALVGYIATHRLNMSREKMSRIALSCTTFRAAVTSAISHVPEPEKHWERSVLDNLPQTAINIGTAVAQFKPFLHGAKKVSLENEWLDLKNHISQIPKILSAADVMYGGGIASALESKKGFHERVNRLLEFAKDT